MTTIEQQLKECLQKPYENAKRFLADVIFPVFGEDNFEDAGNANVLRMLPELQPKADATGIKDIRKVGDLLIEGSELGIFDITLDYKKQLQRNRVEVQQIVRSIIATHSGAFIIFHYESGARWEWRFTFCHKGASASESSDAKRYTFLLGPGQSCRTAAENFTKIHEKIEREGEFEMQDIISAFDVEALSKEFFAKYKNHYERFCQFVYENKNNRQFFGEQFSQWEDKVIRDYVKKLLGRIVFLHFIQKKGWLGVPADKTWNEGDRQFMKNLYDRASQEQKDNYLDIVLEPLFQKGLDRNRSAEGDIFDTCVEGFRNVKIPYLNGGLFERDVMDEPDSRFPSEYFGDLLEFLYEYNFTIDENDPNDAEVGVDPEMLGRIFENLLEDNKDKGAFYTPKEIVQYMCRESLIAYLTTNSIKNGNTNPREAVEKAIRNLVLNPEEIVPKMNDKQKESFGEALRKVKICDPAIGSGAFPMGLLNELVRCRVAISAWAKDNDGNVLIDDYAALKREIVCNNIYGVDIERGAIDIARLRFWLSIVVDEKEPHALPNLDYKFMEGNSLIPTFDGQYINLDTKGQTHRNVGNMIKEKKQLYNLKKEHYNATGLRKHQLAVGIKDCILNLISYQLDYELKKLYEQNSQISFDDAGKSVELKYSDILKKLPEDKQRVCALGAELRKQLNDKNIPVEERAQLDIRFFDWRMMFTEVFEGEKPGFDIVIGNPPYINVELIPQTDKDIYKKCFKCFYKRSDIFALFIENALLRLSSDSAVATFIIPSVVHSNLSYQPLRDIILKKKWLKEVCYTGGKVFNAPTVDTTILVCHKQENNEILLKNAVDFNKHIGHSVPSNYFSMFNNVISIGDKDTDSIFGKLFNPKHPVMDSLFTIYQGIVTGNNPAFIFETKQDAIEKGIEEELLHPMCHGRDIERYAVRSRERQMMYLNNSFVIENFPNACNWLSTFKDSLSERREAKKGTIKWFCLQWPRVQSELDLKEKILVQNTRNEALKIRIAATLDDQGVYGTQGLNFIIPKTDEFSLRYVLGILNSTLINYLFSTKFLNLAIKADFLKQIHIPNASKTVKQSIESLVDTIIENKKENIESDTSDLERRIDTLVYDLYELTYEEIQIVEKMHNL